MEQELANLQALVDTGSAFVVTYGFQLVGGLVAFWLGLVLANWAARKTVDLGQRRDFDPTLTKFAGNLIRILVIGAALMVSLNAIGVTISPFVAMIGAAAFGGTLAIQGVLSNYGAGLAIILARPFRVGNTIQVAGVFGTVEDIRLAHTTLKGEDGERITVPNKEIVGRILVNSEGHRLVEIRLFVPGDQDVEAALAAVDRAVTGRFADTAGPSAHVGIHDFAPGGIVIGVRVWAPSQQYYPTRYTLNDDIRHALENAGIGLATSAPLGHVVTPLSPEAVPPVSA